MTSGRPRNPAYSFSRFKKDGYSLAAFKNGRLFFRSRERNLRPLAKLIIRYGWRQSGLVVYDKYIGRAAAMLLARLSPVWLYTPVISQAAVPVLKFSRVRFTALRRVPHLMGIASRGTCEWEKMSFGRDTMSLWRLVKRRLIR